MLMKMVVGLGNPGGKHARTRHNAGHIFVDWVLGQGVAAKGVVFKKSDAFMNQSGPLVKQFVDYYSIAIDDLYIVHDDLDIALGEFKIQKGIGPKGHNGVLSVEKSLGDTGFWRLRLGVDSRDSENRESGEDYVLGDFSNEEMILFQMALVDAGEKLLDMVQGRDRGEPQ